MVIITIKTLIILVSIYKIHMLSNIFIHKNINRCNVSFLTHCVHLRCSERCGWYRLIREDCMNQTHGHHHELRAGT